MGKTKPTSVASEKAKGKGTGRGKPTKEALKNVGAAAATVKVFTPFGTIDKARDPVEVRLANRVEAYFEELDKNPEVNRMLEECNWVEKLVADIIVPGDRKRDLIKPKKVNAYISENRDLITPQEIAMLVMNAVIQIRPDLVDRSTGARDSTIPEVKKKEEPVKKAGQPEKVSRSTGTEVPKVPESETAKEEDLLEKVVVGGAQDVVVTQQPAPSRVSAPLRPQRACVQKRKFPYNCQNTELSTAKKTSME